MSDEIIYIQDTAEMQYNIPGQAGPVDVLIPSLVPETGGTFTYDGAASLQPGDILCFYIATNPKDRDYLNYSYIDDPEVYVEVENITGNTVTFGALEDEDMELLYNVPDNFPILVAELPTGDIGTININGLDLETYVSILGPTDGTLDNAKAKVSVGDFVSLYTAAYKSAYSAGESTSENDVYYGEVTAYNSITGEITYRITTEKAIEDAMNLYITPDVNGDDLLNEDDRVALEAQLLEQVKKSSFAEDAAFMLADLATKTDGFRSNESIQSLLLSDKDGNPLSEDEIALLNLGASFELTDDIGITVELVTSGDQLHYDNGVQLAIGIDATFEVEIEDEGKVAIDLSASFVEEIALGVNVKGSLVKKKILGIPIPIGVEVNSAVEIKNYTAVNFNVNIYTVAPEEQSTWEKLKDLMADTRVGEVLDKIEELQSKIDQVKEDVETIRGYIQDVESMWQSITTNENNPRVWMETLHKTNITKELMDMMNLSTETGIQSGKYAESMEDLMQKYSEMLETETEWIELINKEIFRFEACYFGLAVSVSGNFITRADINIAMGSSLEYEVGKRYTFWFKIGLFTPTAGSSTMDLIDERFAFQFYVMGKAGLKMGIRAKLSTGIGSTNLASVGIAAELGPYVKVYGFFLYEYEKMRPANSKNWNYSQRKAGALYVDFGVYFILTFEANALSLFEYSHEFINTETSLLTAGEKRFRYGFEFKPQQDEQIRIVDENNDSRDGITMQLPDSLRAISYVDLDTGLLGSESYDYSKYNITLSNPNFSIDNNGKITVNVPTGVQYMECDLTITWLYDKLAFSNYDMSVTIPLVWTNLTSRELNEYFTASVRVGNALEGYQTVWTKRVRKNQAFDLPTTDDIKKLIGYDNYDNGSGTNLKYDELIGYRTDKLKNIAIYTDTVYDFDITLREYSITVNGIQNADGTQTSRVYIAKYGNKFDFSDLTWTGTSIENTSYTKFANVTTTATTSANQVIDLTQPITGKTAIALAADNVTATANYVDDSVVATFEFVGIDYGTITQKLRKNSKPSLAEIEAIAEAANMMIKDITPVVGKLQASTNYIVYLTQMSNIRATIHFEVNGGVQIPDISKIVGSLIGVLPESMRAGYTFAGWYVDSQLTEMFTLDRMSETDITLYAKWTANTYTVTLNANGGSFEGDQNTITIIVVFGESYGELPRPAKTGQGFAGWYTQPEGGELVSRVNIPSDHTLYAQWSEKKTIDDSMMMLDGLTDLVYDGTPKVVTVVSGSVFTVSGGALSVSGSALVPVDTGIFTITYKRTDADDWSDTAINAGLYSVRVSINTAIHTEFAPYEKTFFDIMVINKAPSYFIRTSPNPLTGTVYGRGNITIDKLIPGVDYIGDGTVIYGAINTNYLNDPLYQMWRNSNVLVNLDGNALPGLDYILAAVLAEGENYLGTTEVLMNQDSITIEPGLSHDINSSNGYSFKVRIKTSDIYLAGTDAYIYACLGSNSLPISNGGSTVKAQSQLDDPRVDDFERNSLGEYDLNTVGENFDIMRPMYFELLFNKSGSNPGWHCAWIEIDLYKDGVKLQTSNRINVNRWFENSGDRFETTVQFPRIITGFNDLGDSRDYIDLAADHSGVYNFTFDGIVYDQFRPEGYNAY